MKKRKDPMTQIESIVGREQHAAVMHAKNHHIESFYEKSLRRSLEQLPGETGDVQRAEGMAAGKFGIPIDWCPYDDEDDVLRYSCWQEGYRIGRIYREKKPPNRDVLDRLASLLLRRLKKNERDYELHLISTVAYERGQSAKAQSELAEATKQLKQATGRFGKRIDSPTLMLRIMVEPDNGGWHVYCPGLHGVHTCGDTKEEAIRHALDAMILTLEGVVRDGDELTLEWMQPEESGGNDA